MTATDLAPLPAATAADPAVRREVNLYYFAMAAPFELDLVVSAIYCWVHGLPELFVYNLIGAVIFLLVGGHIIARQIIRPIADFLTYGGSFAAIERRVTQLPILSAYRMIAIYAPILAFRLILPKLGLMMDPGIPAATWADVIVTMIVQLLFIFVFTYFLISAYLDRLCRFLFDRFAVNLGLFFGNFQVKVGVALGFVGLGPLALVATEMFSYSGDRLASEVAVDVLAAAFGLGITLYWVSRSLARPVARLSEGLKSVAAGDLATRLPVTSNEEIGQATAMFNRMAEGLRDRDFLRETFGKYVSESVAAAILQESDRDGHLLGEVRTATLLFTDIDGFTGISENTPPTQLIAVLNEYLALVLEPIQRHGGVVSGFIGDGLFASFNLPASHQSHAASAIAAAVEIQERLREHVFAGGIRLHTRIGINTGSVIGGTVGHADRLSYTLLGDAVNTASRLQEMNKQHGTRILVSATTLELAGQGFDCAHVGEVDIRGRTEKIAASAVNGRR